MTTRATCAQIQPPEQSERLFCCQIKGLSLPSHVYGMHCRGYIKIGVAKDVKKRRAAIQVCNPDLVEVVFTFECPEGTAFDIEGEVHAALEAYSVRGEWFSCSAEVARESVSRAIKSLSDRLAALAEMERIANDLRKLRAENANPVDGLEQEQRELLGYSAKSMWN